MRALPIVVRNILFNRQPQMGFAELLAATPLDPEAFTLFDLKHAG